MGLETIIGLSLAAAGGGAAAISAKKQNDQIESAEDAAVAANAMNRSQILGSAAQQRDQRIDEFNQLAARIRVARGEAGVGAGGSTAAAIRQTEFNTEADLGAINLNAFYGQQRGNSATLAQIAQLSSRTENPLLAAFMGGLQGGAAGLQIGGAISGLGAAATPQSSFNSFPELLRTLPAPGRPETL